MIYYLHPAAMAVVVLLLLAQLRTGWMRAQGLHLGKAVRFPRRQHATLGRYVLLGILAGAVFGALVTYKYAGDTGLTGAHYDNARLLLPFVFYGYISGVLLARSRKEAATLPVLHGLCNVVLVALALLQAYTGVGALTRMTLTP